MRSSIKIAPPNSILFLAGRIGERPPDITRDRRIWATPYCIAFGCLAFMDGETEIVLGDLAGVGQDGTPAFEGILETPNHRLIVWTAEHEKVLSSVTLKTRTRVRIWTNDPVEPSKVVIVLD